MMLESSQAVGGERDRLADNAYILPAACFAILAVSVVANVVVPGLGVLLALALLSALFHIAPARCLELIIVALLFQNVIVAMSMDPGGSMEDVNVARATNFVICGGIWLLSTLYYLREWRIFSPVAQAVMLMTYLLIALILCFFVYGYSTQGAPAVIYLRNYLTPLFCLQVSVFLSFFSTSLSVLWIGRLLLAYCCVELTFGDSFLRLLSADAYLLAGKDLLEIPVGEVGEAFAVQLFNTPLLGDHGLVYRMNGPNLHPISLGYALATFALYCLSRRRLAEMMLYFPPLIFASSKGALLYFAFTALGIAGARKLVSSAIFFGIAALATVTSVAIFFIGQQAGDFHILGLIGSVRGFLENPLGSGLGAGGNLTMVLTYADWQRAQQLGYTEVAVESAVGVALYQMGVAAGALVAFYVWLAWLFWKRYLATDNQILLFGSFAVLITLANGLFQEEALFAPLCLGLVLLLAGSGMNQKSPSSAGPTGQFPAGDRTAK
jgi:hypothetical protein